MFKAIKSTTIRLVLTANVIAVLAMIAVGNSDRIPPTEHPTLSVLGLIFPAFIVLNLLFIPLWVFIKPKNLLVPLLGFILSYVPVRTYCPVNLPEEPPAGAIKVLSYNTMMLHSEKDDEGNTVNSVVDYIIKSDPDIACLQEAWMGSANSKPLRRHYPFVEAHIINKGNSVMLASRYPIINVERIFYKSSINGSVAFYLKIENDTVIVINNHLESNVFTLEDRQQVSDIVSGRLKSEVVKTDTRNLLEKVTRAAKIRTPQVDSIAQYVQNHSQYPIILCGDFNSWPNSYPHYRLSNLLTDCYTETGLGPGWTYNRNHIDVRIDNIMCSHHWKPYACFVDDKATASDHFPVTCWLKYRQKE